MSLGCLTTVVAIERRFYLCNEIDVATDLPVSTVSDNAALSPVAESHEGLPPTNPTLTLSKHADHRQHVVGIVVDAGFAFDPVIAVTTITAGKVAADLVRVVVYLGERGLNGLVRPIHDVLRGCWRRP